jgi:uncharacterized protein
MKYRYQKNHRSHQTILIAGIILGLAIGLFIYLWNPIVQTQVIYENRTMPFFSKINLLAVDQDGNGVATPLIVEAMPGDGKILTDIEKLLFWTDTQQSIQTARDVALNAANIDMSDYDIIYTISSDATVIGGPSAGAALTIATVAALENKTLKDDIVITGTIEPNGSIGEVGGVLEKAKAAKNVGAKIFLVPEGQSQETYLRPQENCTRRAGFIFCETTYNRVTVNIGDDVGISVIEVGNVDDALKYFGL